jgi:hypothetical protein
VLDGIGKWLGTIGAVLPMAVPNAAARDGRDPMPWTSPVAAPDEDGPGAMIFVALPGSRLYARFSNSANGWKTSAVDSATVRVIIATIHVCGPC